MWTRPAKSQKQESFNVRVSFHTGTLPVTKQFPCDAFHQEPLVSELHGWANHNCIALTSQGAINNKTNCVMILSARSDIQTHSLLALSACSDADVNVHQRVRRDSLHLIGRCNSLPPDRVGLLQFLGGQGTAVGRACIVYLREFCDNKRARQARTYPEGRM